MGILINRMIYFQNISDSHALSIHLDILYMMVTDSYLHEFVYLLNRASLVNTFLLNFQEFKPDY